MASTSISAYISAGRWGPERRLEFIDFRLLWDRTINRAELMTFFGISAQQASADLAKYSELAAENLIYDKSAKTYRATSRFVPRFARASAQAYLGQLADVVLGHVPEASVFIGWSPPCDVLRLPVRSVETSTLLRVLWAIRDRHDLQIIYQSMRRPEPTVRWIAPHALASDGARWHVRAWCYESNQFKDFVMSRLQRVLDEREPPANLPRDEDWDSYIDVPIRPRKGLTPGQRAAIEVDYGMVAGRLLLRCRRALAFYLIRLFQLDRPPSTPVIEQPLELESNAELSSILEAARKTPETDRSAITNHEGD